VQYCVNACVDGSIRKVCGSVHDEVFPVS
jgi:hypothetical protein